MGEAWGVLVDPRDAERTRRILARHGLLARGLRPRGEAGAIVFPVVDPEAARRALAAQGVPHRLVRTRFEERRPGAPRLEGRVKGYVVIGDIALFSQAAGVPREEYVEAARRLVEEHPRVRAAWLKTRTTGDYRVSSLVHLAGEERTRTVASEYGLRVHVDLARAYYNPRLSYEHRRVATLVTPGERVLDMFTGVGVFPLHIASLVEADVVGVDLNRDAVRLASLNARENEKRLKGSIHLFHADARVLPEVFRPVFDRVIMNLPGASLEFVPVACRLLRSPAAVHIYIRSISGLEAAGAAEEAFAREGCRAEVLGVREALDYSPHEAVYAVDLRVTR